MQPLPDVEALDGDSSGAVMDVLQTGSALGRDARVSPRELVATAYRIRMDYNILFSLRSS